MFNLGRVFTVFTAGVNENDTYEKIYNIFDTGAIHCLSSVGQLSIMSYTRCPYSIND